MGECGSARLPKTRAFSGQASTQAGGRPRARRSPQKLHFSTTPLVRVGNSGLGLWMYGRGSCQLKLREPYGQAAMQ